jgi:hypothetical protein
MKNLVIDASVERLYDAVKDQLPWVKWLRRWPRSGGGLYGTPLQL